MEGDEPVKAWCICIYIYRVPEPNINIKETHVQEGIHSYDGRTTNLVEFSENKGPHGLCWRFVRGLCACP